MSSETKKCPYCAEEINKDAIKCKHCGEILDEENFKLKHKEKTTVNKTVLPQSFQFAIFIGIISILLSIVQDYFNSNEDIDVQKAGTLVGFFYVVSDVWILFFLAKYLKNFQSGNVIKWIYWMIGVDIGFEILDIATTTTEADTSVNIVAIIGLFIISLFVYLMAGNKIKKIKDDYVGLLKPLGMSIAYVLPLGGISFFAAGLLGNSTLSFIGSITNLVPTVILILIFQRASGFPRLQTIKNEFVNRAQSDKINDEKNNKESTQTKKEETISTSNITKYGFSILAVIAIIFKIYFRLQHTSSNSEEMERQIAIQEARLQNPTKDTLQSKNDIKIVKAQADSSAITSNKKLRYLFYSNGGLRGYFDDGSITSCPQCDLIKANVNYLFSEDPFETYTIEDGYLLINGVEKEYPDSAQDWAMIDYKWIVDVPDSL